MKLFVGIDESGEKARGAFARGFLVCLEVLKRNTDNLNSSCKEGDRWLYLYLYVV